MDNNYRGHVVYSENKKPDKTVIIAIIAIVSILVVVGLIVGLVFFVYSSNEKDDKISTTVKSEEKDIHIKRNDIDIRNNVVYIDGDQADDKAIVQYKKPKQGEIIATIKVKGYGNLVVRFFPEHAPLAVENFLIHAKEGYYDGLTFHRVIDDFMIQGGDPEGDGTGGESIWCNEEGENVPFTDEYSKYLMPIRGALCMANAGQNTNGSQFFIVQSKEYMITDVVNLRQTGVDDELVDYYKDNGGAGWLYGKHTVFGQLIEGYDVLDLIAGAIVDAQSKPEKDVIIETIEIDEYK